MRGTLVFSGSLTTGYRGRLTGDLTIGLIGLFAVFCVSGLVSESELELDELLLDFALIGRSGFTTGFGTFLGLGCVIFA